MSVRRGGHLGHAAPGEAEEYAFVWSSKLPADAHTGRRKDNLLKPSVLASGLGSVQSPDQVSCCHLLCVDTPKLSFLSTEASAAQPDRRHVEILP